MAKDSRVRDRVAAGLLGAAGGFLAGLFLAAWWASRRDSEDAGQDIPLEGLEESVLAELLADQTLRSRDIQVGIIAPGIVELVGTVGTRAEAERAVRLAQRAPGVETVVNRLQEPSPSQA